MNVPHSFLLSFGLLLSVSYSFQYVNETVSFQDANLKCRQLYDTDLASVHSDDDLALVLALCDPVFGPCWLGGFYHEGDWQWMDATPWDYEHWGTFNGVPQGQGLTGEYFTCIWSVWGDEANIGDCGDNELYYPICNPSTVPSTLPSCTPSQYPSADPTNQRSTNPSAAPTGPPSQIPTADPSSTAVPSSTRIVTTTWIADTSAQNRGMVHKLAPQTLTASTIFGVVVLTIFIVVLCGLYLCYKRQSNDAWKDDTRSPNNDKNGLEMPRLTTTTVTPPGVGAISISMDGEENEGIESVCNDNEHELNEMLAEVLRLPSALSIEYESESSDGMYEGPPMEDEKTTSTTQRDVDHALIEWLQSQGLSHCLIHFVTNGYESLDFVKDITTVQELIDIGIKNKVDQNRLMRFIQLDLNDNADVATHVVDTST